MAGYLVGPLAGSISTVELLIKTQLQLDNVSEKRFRSTWHCFTSIVREKGIGVLYLGHGINVAREATFLGTYFFTYEGTRQLLLDQILLSAHLAVPISGGVAGAWAWFVSFPLDCVRAGIQGRPLTAERMGALEVAKNLYHRKGIRGLYSGVKPSIIRAFLVSASRFSAYELALRLIH
jgi:solute carrier family 25 carnitine/acylcarnitine transporter 20/29